MIVLALAVVLGGRGVSPHPAVVIGKGLASSKAAAPVDLRCEGATNPLGIDEPWPRLSWIDVSAEPGRRQTAYQILVASSPSLIDQDKGDLWDSGRVASDESIGRVYQGRPLPSRARGYWKVRTWDGRGKASAWSATASWAMGLLKPSDWSAQWIGRDEDTNSIFGRSQWIGYPEGDPAQSAPLATRYFRRTFDVTPGQRMTRATCDLTVDDAYELRLNGRKIGEGDSWMKPGRYDLTGHLLPGKNTVEIRATNVGTAPNPAGVLARIRIEFQGKAPLDVVSDGEWEASADRVQWSKGKVLAAFGAGPWNAAAIGHDYLPARYLRREFRVTKKVAHATAYVCGLGFFDLLVNGKRASDHVMDPALSDYDKTCYYVTLDVTKRLRSGANALGVVLGNGRYYSPRTIEPFPSQTFGPPKLRLQLEIDYVDGTKASVLSDETWRITTEGPIRMNNEYDGETYDARLEMPGWDLPGFRAKSWRVPQIVSGPAGVLRAQTIPPMRVTETIRPASVRRTGPGRYLVDMGQAFYGTIRLKASAPRGTRVKMVSAYAEKADGTLKTADNRTARSTDLYTFKGHGIEVWNPRFRGQGYRRVEVTGFPGVLTTANFEGLVIHTDVEPIGEFACSSGLINRLHSALRWGERSFMRSAPLDPDRDERQAWTGDPAKDAESEAYSFDVAAFYVKWMDDVASSQRPDGTLPDVAMYWRNGAGVEWPSVFTIIPDWFVDFYGDRRLGAKHYAKMKKWVEAMQRYRLSDGTLPPTSFGDWCDTSTIDGKVSDNGSTPRDLISTAYQYRNCQIVARFARLTGRPADARKFEGWAEALRAAFNRKFFDPAHGTYQGETQCGYVLALKFGLVPPAYRPKVVENLVSDIMVKHRGHLSVGLIGMQWLMQTLTEIGHPEVAWTIVTQTTRPSWGYMLAKGATTIWERWDYDTRDPGMNSENLLIQAGNLDAWFYQTLAGIQCDPASPGFKHFFVRPYVPRNLTWARASFKSPYGRIVSAWKRTGKRLTLEVTVPANTSATILVPGTRAARKAGPGTHRFTTNLP
jgi:alpha-L-rhamnosidase